MTLRTVTLSFGVYILVLLVFCDIRTTNAQRTVLDNFINEYRTLRYGLFKFIGRSDTSSSYLWNLKRQVIFCISDGFRIVSQWSRNILYFDIFIHSVHFQKVQKPYPKTTKFPCNTTHGAGARSATPPSSVHRLRPGDIDVIGAIGDSLTGLCI